MIVAIMLMATLAIAQPMPSTGTIVAGKVTFHGERVDSAVVEINVPAKKYRKELRSSFLHKELNYYISNVKAGLGDYIVVTASYGGMNSSNYAIKGSEQSYIINIEVTDKPRLPSANTTSTITTTTVTTTTTTTPAAVKETTTSTIPKTTSTSSATTTDAVHDFTTTSNTASIKEDGGGFYTIAIVAAAIVLVLFIYGVISRRS